MSDETPAVPEGPSVLLGFRVKNVRSFRDEAHLSLLATTLAEAAVVREVPWREDGATVRVLPVAGIFGANASGKTTLLRAMDDMRSLVLGSFRTGNPTGGIPRKPFLLDPSAVTRPSRFEIDLVLGGIRYEYGFAVDDDHVKEEWAVRYPRGRAALIFERHNNTLKYGASDRTKSRAIEELLRPNALFLSTAAAANHPLLLPLYSWFERNLLLAEAGSRPHRQSLTTLLLEKEDTRAQVLGLLRAADLGVTGARRNQVDLDPEGRALIVQGLRLLIGQTNDAIGLDDAASIEAMDIRLTHTGVDGEVEFAPEDESMGTSIWLGLVGPVIDVLSKGSVLLADELDASLHPALVTQLVRLFQDPQTNPHRAQLIFNSHDVTLLGDSVGDRLIGRDQVWFTEKRNDGSAHLYPLSDLDPRKSEAMARRYLSGRYGAVPILSPQEFDAVAELITGGTRG